MPTFPPYPPELPRCLNPWSIRHWLLVIYWVFFRPSALKCYLYQVDPEFYRNPQGTPGQWKSWLGKSQIRHLLLTALLGTLSVGLAGGILISGLLALVNGHANDQVILIFISAANRVLFAVAVGVALGVALGVASGVALGVAFGVAVGVGWVLGSLRVSIYLFQGGGLRVDPLGGNSPHLVG